LKIVLTVFADGKIERAIFTYAIDDPCQLRSIAYTPARATANPSFNYNLNGCQLNDERGQQLKYDSQNRLLDVEAPLGQVISRYRYDSHDHLVTSQHGTESETLRFFQGEQLSTVVQDDRKTRLLYHADQPLGQQVAGDISQTLLLQTDANHSVIAESQQNNLRTAVYSAYGDRHSDQPMFSLRAFNGEVRENSGWYLLGRGYRAYNPSLMRFHSPDSLSPFGSGGVNPYGYCLGNPIALRDPTGHSAIGFSGRPKRPDEGAVPGLSTGGGGSGWISWIFVAVGVLATIAGVAATIATAGAAAPLAGYAFGFTVAKAISIATGTALGAGSTIAGGFAAAGKQEAVEWSLYLGVSALPFALFSAAFGGAAQYVQSLQGFDDLLAILKPTNVMENMSLKPFRLARPSLISAAARPPAEPIPPAAPAAAPPTPLPPSAPGSFFGELLSRVTGGARLRSTPVSQPAPKNTRLTDLQIAVQNRGATQFNESGNPINTGGLRNAQELARTTGIPDSTIENPLKNGDHRGVRG
jgi:RHS repeat-associated protein